MSKVHSSKPRSINPGLSSLAEQRLRRSLRKSAPSEAWVDAQIVSFTDRAPGGREIVYRFHDPRAFPPGGRRTTPMRWCRCCGRFSPPACVALVETRHRHDNRVIHATLRCDDCRIADDECRYRELFAALPNLRSAGSQSVVQMHERG